MKQLTFARFEIQERKHSPNAIIGITDDDRKVFITAPASALGKQLGDRLANFIKDSLQLNADELELLSCPGDTILETLEVKGMHLLDFALAMSRLPDEINDIIAGKTPINHVIAEQLEQVLGIDAQFWLNSEALYRAKLSEFKK